MEASLVITDLTRMNGDRVCIAGVNKGGKSIRPEFEHGGIQESWLYDRGRAIIRPFAVVCFDFQRNIPNPPHTEDWIIRGDFKDGDGLLSKKERLALLQRIADPAVAAIFGAEIHHEQGFYVKENEGTRSLGTVLVARIDNVSHRCYDGKWDYRISFTDQAGTAYRLGVTDLAFRYYLNHLREQQAMDGEEIGDQLTTQLQRSKVYLRIGLARPTWAAHPHCCYLQINGVYTFPDYLEGRCFADFTNYN